MFSYKDLIFLNKAEEQKVVEAIKSAEKQTSGEIRVHIESKVKKDEDIMACAIKKFEEIGMHKTKDRNGCLIFIDLINKRFAIIGDKAINEKVETNFWTDTAKLLNSFFKERKYADGLCAVINLIGERLKKYFPYQSNDINELQDEISYT